VPQYFVMLGGGVDENGAQFGRISAKVPARRMPQVVDRLLGSIATRSRRTKRRGVLPRGRGGQGQGAAGSTSRR
jgi:hypothetical protein